MQIALRMVTLSFVALLYVAASAFEVSAQGPCSLFGCFFGHRCGGSCEPGCGCEPSSGCESSCGMDGRQFAGQSWSGCGEDGPRMCYCTDASGHCASGGCGVNSCGRGCEPTCATEPSCGCSSGSCNSSPGCSLFDCLFGCTGCGSEFYWSEWHNDPPRCCDPCDCYGNWIGPSTGYRAPYAHPYAVGGSAPMPYYANANQRGAATPNFGQAPIQGRPANLAARNANAAGRAQVAKTYSANRTTRVPPAVPPAPIARRPSTLNRTIQR